MSGIVAGFLVVCAGLVTLTLAIFREKRRSRRWAFVESRQVAALFRRALAPSHAVVIDPLPPLPKPHPVPSERCGLDYAGCWVTLADESGRTLPVGWLRGPMPLRWTMREDGTVGFVRYLTPDGEQAHRIDPPIPVVAGMSFTARVSKEEG